MSKRSRGRPKKSTCVRGHDLTNEENVRHTKAKRPCGDTMKVYDIRVCKLCEKIRRMMKKAKEQ